MSEFDRARILAAGGDGQDGDAAHFQVAADACLARGDEDTAIAALDRAYGLAPDDEHIAEARAVWLARRSVEAHGLVFRYIPAGTFLMGSTSGDPDEQPVHPVFVDAFWMAEIPITWAAFAELMGWSPPPSAGPEDPGEHGFYLHQLNKIRMQYCESETRQARDWHAHIDSAQARALFGTVEREHPGRPIAYDRKPMICASWSDGEELGARLGAADDGFEYGLPSEAEWEKAARGGLIAKRYPWGDEPPDRERCDFDHFGDYHIADPRRFAPNGYGLHGMSGGVWEWTSSFYDALAYAGADAPAEQLERRVLRGGSWADAAAAVTVSFRTAAVGASWRQGWGDCFNPNYGLRLVRRLEPR